MNDKAREAVVRMLMDDYKIEVLFGASDDDIACVTVGTLMKLAALQWAASQQAAEGWKLVGYTCGDGDCGRIHDEMGEEDGYMQPVYVRAAPAQQAAENGDTLYLWKDGDRFLAYKHPYPCYSPGGDPMTLGEPFARAEFRASHDRAAAPTAQGERDEQ